MGCRSTFIIGSAGCYYKRRRLYSCSKWCAHLLLTQEPYTAFQGLANKTVELTYNSTPSLTGAKTAIVKTLDDEYRLRNLAWIEDNRKRVDEATNGEAGYIYVPSTGLMDKMN